MSNSNISNERKALHEFICATVAACVASIYPRADSRRFRRIIDSAVRGTEVAASAEECEAEYCTRSGCDCPCCEVAHAKLRAISFKARPAAAHHFPGPCQCQACRDYAYDFERAKARARAELDSFDAEEAVRATPKEYHETDTDAR